MTTLEKIREIVIDHALVGRRVLKPAVIVKAARLIDDLGLDELDRISIVLDIEGQFPIAPVTDERLETIVTVGDLVALAEDRAAAGAAA